MYGSLGLVRHRREMELRKQMQRMQQAQISKNNDSLKMNPPLVSSSSSSSSSSSIVSNININTTNTTTTTTTTMAHKETKMTQVLPSKE